ncbi:MAG: TatD family hydrolase [Pseudogulbenkiania sp.]|nr:TatD family hydrolase [Pseudogulbenkiania sp.]
MFPFLPANDCLIDSHCHLDAAEFDGVRDDVVAEAIRQGIGQILVPAVNQATFAETLAMRERYGCWLAFGLHPIYLAQHLDEHLADLEHKLATDRPVAVGDIGLDFYLPALDPVRQEYLLVEQLKLARKYGLPVILHVRRSQDRLLKYLRQVPVVGGIAHAFNGSEQQAAAFLARGFKLGFGGAMTFRGSQRIRRLAATLPLSALVLETDAPDMRPEWAQAVPNRPANLLRFAEFLAELRTTTPEAIRTATHHNTLQALGLG